MVLGECIALGDDQPLVQGRLATHLQGFPDGLYCALHCHGSVHADLVRQLFSPRKELFQRHHFAVQRGQETVGAYVDDAGITATVKARFVENKQVDAAAISVETLKGTVMLSGFAKNATERSTAETIAWGVKGVTGVKNEIVVRP